MRVRWVPAFLRRDFKNKAFALFFAVTIWYFAWNNQITVSKRTAVPVKVTVGEVEGGDSDYVKVSVTTRREATETDFADSKVELQISGPQREIREIDWTRVVGAVTIHPEQWPEDRGYRIAEVELTPEHFTVPSRSLTIVEGTIKPSMIFVWISPRVVSEIPVIPKISGTPPPPYSPRGWTVEPERLLAFGPKCYFTYYEIVTDTVDVSDVTPQITPQGWQYATRKSVHLRIRENVSKEDPLVKRLLAAPSATSLVLVEESRKIMRPENKPVKVTVLYEQEELQRRSMQVKLWAQVPLETTHQKPFAVECDPPRIDVTFEGTEEEIRTIERNHKNDPTHFGLFFVVEPDWKLGDHYPRTPQDLRWDPNIIPPNVRVGPAEGTPGTGSGPAVFDVMLVPADGSR